MPADRAPSRSAAWFVTNAIVRGVIVILPIAIGVTTVIKVAGLMKRVLAPVARFLPDWVRFDGLVALLITLLGCLLVGLVAGSSWGGRAILWFEESVMGLIPGYRTMRTIVRSFFGQADTSGWSPALIRLDETWQPGFVVEAHADGQSTVFVPGAPTPTSGDVHIVGPERVRRVTSHPMRIIRSLSRFGEGVEDLKKSTAPEGPPPGPRG